jgi:hypothetical protein
LISQVVDILPHLGEGFIEACLSTYNWDVEKTISAILSNDLPPALATMNQSTPRSFPQKFVSSLGVTNRFAGLFNLKHPRQSTLLPNTPPLTAAISLITTSLTSNKYPPPKSIGDTKTEPPPQTSSTARENSCSRPNPASSPPNGTNTKMNTSIRTMSLSKDKIRRGDD